MTSTPTTNPSLNPALKSFWSSKADVRVLKGGRASSKTWDAAGFAIFLAKTYRVKFLCMRQYQNKIQESVYATLVIQINRFNLSHEFDILKTTIRHKSTGSEFHFYGIHRNIGEIKGFEGADIGWIEEGEGMTKEQWSIIEPTLRKEGSEAWLIYNPRFVTDFVETQFIHNPKDGVIVRHINYDENPFLSDTMARKITRLKNQNIDEYEHIYLGVAREDSSFAVIGLAWIHAAIDANKKLGMSLDGQTISGLDVADEGADSNAQAIVKGNHLFSVDEWKKGDTGVTSRRAVSSCNQHGVDSLQYDCIGVGAGVKAETNRLKGEGVIGAGLSVVPWNAGASVQTPERNMVEGDTDSPKWKDFAANLKAQGWWSLRQRFEKTHRAVTKGEQFPCDELISIDGALENLHQLTNELTQVIYKHDGKGRVVIDKKPAGTKSPNLADSVVMAFWPVRKPRFFA